MQQRCHGITIIAASDNSATNSRIGSYYRRFIPNFARVAEPLQRLIPDEVEFIWGQEQAHAFAAIQQALINATEVAHPRPGAPFIIDCDASQAGLGAVLSQKDERGAERPIAFASRVLRANEKKWAITELEAFAVVWALETFRTWIEGSPTLVRTDHSPLLWVRNNQGKSHRLARWVLRLQDFAFDLQHRAGSHNKVPDALSRYPTGLAPDTPHDVMAGTCICAYIDATERCQSCWGQHNAFQTRGGVQTLPFTAQTPAVQPRSTGVSNKPETAPGLTTMQEAQSICPETIALRQYLDGGWGARLPKWVEVAELMPVLNHGVLCLRKRDGDGTRRDRIHVPIHLRTPIVQRLHAGREAGHFGYKKTLAKLHQRYIWPNMTRDVKKVMRT